MAGNDDVNVKFGADTSAADANIKGLASFLSGFASGVVGELKDQFALLTSGFRQSAAAANEAAAATKHLEEGETSLLARLRETTAKLHEQVESFNAFKSKLGEVAEVYAVAFAVERVIEFAKQMGEAADQTVRTAQTLGIATIDVQHFQTVANATGASVDSIEGAMMRLDRTFGTARGGSKKTEAAFAALGISTRQNYTQTELFNTSLEKLNRMDSGPAKIALAMSLFGENVKDIAPLLNMTEEQLAAVNEQQERYGTVSQDATAKGLALADAFNENKNAGQGLMNVLTESLAPAFTSLVEDVNGFIAALIENYREGGIVKVLLETIAATLRTVGVIFTEIGHIISTVWNVAGKDTADAGNKFNLIAGIVQAVGAAFVGFGTIVQLVLQAGANAVMGFVSAVRGMGTVVGDVLSGHWDKVAGDAKAGWTKVNDTSRTGWNKLKAITADGQAQLDRLSAPKTPKLPETGGGGSTAGLPTGAGKKGPQGPSIVSIWEEQLHAAEIASNDFFTDQTANELAFWQGKLGLVTKGSKDWLAVQSKIYDLSKTLAHQGYDEQIAQYAQQSQVAQGYADRQLAIEQQKTAFVIKTYGAQSKQGRDAQREMERAEQQHQARMVEIEQKALADHLALANLAASTDLAIERDHTKVAEVGIDQRLKNGEISSLTAVRQQVAAAAELRSLEAETAEAQYDNQLRSMERSAALEQQGSDKQIAALQAIEQFTEQHEIRIRQLRADTSAAAVEDAAKIADAVRAKWTGIVEPITGAFTSMFQGLATASLSWRDGLIQVGDSLVSAFVGWVGKMIQQWIIKEFTQTSLATTGEAARTGVAAAGAAVRVGVVAGETGAVVAGEGVKAGATVVSQGARTATSFAGTLLRIGHEILGATVGVAVHGAATLAHIAMDAARAAAGAYAAIAGIPFVGPFLAPIAAIAALAGVLALGKSIFSAEGGFGNVPADGTITELHKQEMVLPARYANPLRDALDGAGVGARGVSAALAGQATPANTNTPEVHLHHAPSYQIAPVDVMAEIRRNPGEMKRVIQNMARNGDLNEIIRKAVR